MVDASVAVDAPALCASAADCDDGRYCNGIETCDPANPTANRFGCVGAEPPCLAGQTCSEDTDACLSACDVDSDADDDGHVALNCGGDDCDDARADVAPGFAEVCDALGIDEDCDPATLGDDADGDGHVAASCCNDRVCGDDCDDADAARHPGATEVCNGRDDDCNGLLDAPLEDRDRDGHGAPECGGDDCDDVSASAWPGAPELCNGRDDDCDGASVFDEIDRDGDGSPPSTACTLPGLSWDCDDRVRDVGPSALELCNGRDDDCDASVDEGLTGCVTNDPAVEVEVGTSFACARRASGRIACWGSDELGQHGDGAPGSFSPVPVPAALGINDAVDLELGAHQACVIRRDRTIACWGNSPFRRRDTPTPEGPPDAVALAAGNDFACALRSDGRVSCWGANDRGQLGGGTTGTTRGIVDVIGINSAIAISAGDQHACAVLVDGTARCWGENSYGRLGDGSTTNAAVPVEVLGLRYAVTIAAGVSHTCALDARGSAWCWGRNDRGQLGVDRWSVDRVVAGPMSAPVPFRTIAAGRTTTCATTAEGAAYCWGDYLRPTEVPGLMPVRHLDTGGGTTCAVRANGTIACRGARASGQLGDSGSSAFPWLVPAIDLHDARSIDAGTSTLCAARGSGDVVCWGLDATNDADAWSSRPAALPGFADARRVECEYGSVVAIDSSGTLSVIGLNRWGALGVGYATPVTTAVAVSAWGTVASVGFEGSYLCAVLVDGTVRCAGNNSYEQLGTSSIYGSSIPLEVPGITSAISVKGEGTVVRAALADGSVVGWGSWSSVDVTTMPPTRGLEYRCLIDTIGDVWCRGENTYGEVGDGTRIRRDTTYVRVVDLHDVTDVSDEGAATCAISSGQVYCWGATGFDALRDLDPTRPQRVPGIDDAIEVVVRGSSRPTTGYGCILRATGDVVCWGDDSRGQLGDGLGGEIVVEPVTVRPLP
jgi:alpha-tubulin suppressor-like RCC1 family protein